MILDPIAVVHHAWNTIHHETHNHLSQHDIKFVGNNLHPINLLSLINTSTLPKE